MRFERREFQVVYDPARISEKDLLAAVRECGGSGGAGLPFAGFAGASASSSAR